MTTSELKETITQNVETPVIPDTKETVVEAPTTKTRKPRKKAAKPKPKVPVRGQSAEPLGLSFEAFNAKEKRIMAILDPNGSGTRTILDRATLLAATGWAKKGAAKGDSRLRNNLRRPVREGFVEHPEDIKDGRYRISQRGRNAQNKALGRGGKAAHTEVEAPLPEADQAPVEVEAAQLA